MEESLLRLQELATDFGMRIVMAAVIFFVGKWLSVKIRDLLRTAFQKKNLDETLISFACNLSLALMMTFVFIAALARLGIQTASFIAVLGAAGLAIGLALQGSLANFASGVLILTFRPFRIGDYVEAGGTAGIIRDISIFTTTLHTPDNRKIIVPNAQITGGTIVNVSALDTRRLDLTASVSYGDDIDTVRSILQGIVEGDERILKDPEPAIVLTELGSSSVDFAVRVWVKKEDFWDVRFASMEKIKKEFDARGVTIPFPQQDVHLYREES